MKSKISVVGRHSGKYHFEIIRLKYTPCLEEFLVHHHKTRGFGSVFFNESGRVAHSRGVIEVLFMSLEQYLSAPARAEKKQA